MRYVLDRAYKFLIHVLWLALSCPPSLRSGAGRRALMLKSKDLLYSSVETGPSSEVPAEVVGLTETKT